MWNHVNRRMAETAPAGVESAVVYKARPRRMALRTSTKTVTKAVGAMRSRARQIWKAKGKDLARD